MSSTIPVLKMGDLALVSIQIDMDDQLALSLQEDLSQRILDWRARGVIIDISALDIVDSFIGRVLANIAQIASLLDARTVVVGMQPAVAITMVELGINLAGVRTALNLEKGVWLLRDATVDGEALTPSVDSDDGQDPADSQ
ncbi:MAG: STAS domain-containing protein [Opitutales bacterium]